MPPPIMAMSTFTVLVIKVFIFRLDSSITVVVKAVLILFLLLDLIVVSRVILIKY
jgi:hypothetical protein